MSGAQRHPKNFLRDEGAAAAAEFALVAIVFIGMLLGIIDMARFAWEFNSAKAAARVGARYAVVSPPVIDELVDFDAVTACGVAGGELLPSDSLPDYSCTSSGCTTTGSGACSLGGPTLNSTNFNAIVAQMQAYDARIAAANVVIRYQERGLGVAGNPYGTDTSPLVSVSLQNMTFSPIALEIFGVTFAMPSVSTTFTAEDFG